MINRNVFRETVIALMNTGKADLTTEVSIADVFTDGVSPFLHFVPLFRRLSQSEASGRASYYLYDLWGKEDRSGANGKAPSGPKYGKFEGIVQGRIKNVRIRSHQTRVWKLAPIWGAQKRNNDNDDYRWRRKQGRYDL